MLNRHGMRMLFLISGLITQSLANEPDKTRSVHLTPFPQTVGPLQIPQARTDPWPFELEPLESAQYNVTIASSGTSPAPEEHIYNLVSSSIAVSVLPEYNENTLWAWQAPGGGQSYVCDVVNTVWVNNTALVSINCRWERTLTGGSGSGASGLGFDPINGWALGLATHKQSDFEVRSSVEIDGAPEYLRVNEMIDLHAWLVIGEFPEDDSQPVDAVWSVEPVGSYGGGGDIVEEYPTAIATFVAETPGRVRVTATVPNSSPTLTDSVEFTIYRVKVKEIHFDHNVNSMNADGVTINKNQTTPITAPEWRLSPAKNEPACYIKDTVATVKVKLGVEPENITSVIIAASPVLGGATGLPSLGQQTVTFTEGVSGLTDFTLTAPGTVKILEDSWEWEVSAINGTTIDACIVDTTEDHKVYVILTTPKAPMVKPWVRVLEYACHDDFAGGTTTEVGAMNLIVDGLFSSSRVLGLDYREVADYTTRSFSTMHFNLTRFLNHIDNPQQYTGTVNCKDINCATIIFASSVGGGFHWRRKFSYRQKHWLPIQWARPMRWNAATDQTRHLFIQKDGGGAQGNVWDATFALYPGNWPDPSLSWFSPPVNYVLPRNMVFQTYHQLLVDAAVSDWRDPYFGEGPATGIITVD